MNAWCPAAIQETLTAVTDYVADEAAARGWRAPEKQKRVGHYIGITPPNPLADEIMTKLENENIYLSRRGPGLRIAPHLFNDRRDIERLFAVLDGLTE